MGIMNKNAIWQGFETEVKAVFVLAIHSTYEKVGMSKEEVQAHISAPYYMDDTEDFVWFALHLLEAGQLSMKNIGLNSFRFTPIELEVLKRYFKHYKENNINPLQIFIEPLIENTVFGFVNSSNLSKKISFNK